MNVRRSISINFVAKYVEHGLALFSGIVLARLLTPEDFGIYSIAASVVLLGYLFRNFGVGQYIVQAANVTDEMLRAAFAVTLFVSWTIGLLLVAIAPALGRFYAEDGVSLVLYFLSFNFFLLPFGAVTNALLRREMRFEKIAVIDISAAVTAMVVGLTAAFMGASYLSIAWASNASTVVSIMVTLLFRPAGTPWLPGVKGFRNVLSFGVKVGAMDLSNSGTDSATELVIGKAHGLHDLGIYSRAYGTFRLFEFAFVQTIRPVVLPFLSRAKHDNEDLGDIYLKILTLTSIFAIPFFAYMGVNAAEVIALLYGDQWGAATPVLQVMCVAGALFAPTLFFEQMLIANGRPGQAMRFVVLSQCLRLGALAVLAWVSLEAAALALIVGFLARVAFVVSLARQFFGLDIGGFTRAVLPAVMVAGLLVLSTVATRSLVVPGVGSFLLLLVTGVIALVLWLLFVFVTAHPVSFEIRRLLDKALKKS